VHWRDLEISPYLLILANSGQNSVDSTLSMKGLYSAGVAKTRGGRAQPFGHFLL